ncbi:UNVERIFIED_CONTAM: hypothetical protein Sangu_0831500, partial [Sesamum angustifolium]
RLYSSRVTAEHMTWHATHQIEEESMYHPSDVEAWKHFDRMYPDFAEESRNVWLGLRTYGFAPHDQFSYTYSCWPIIITPYNLPPVDHSMDWAFMMRAALMWIVNDLPAYRIASGWSTAWVMGCPVCMDDTRIFHLQHIRKACYIDCHRQFHPAHHSYRRNKKAFTKNHVENKVARPRLT